MSDQTAQIDKTLDELFVVARVGLDQCRVSGGGQHVERQNGFVDTAARSVDEAIWNLQLARAAVEKHEADQD